jgi:hypothetical protein
MHDVPCRSTAHHDPARARSAVVAPPDLRVLQHPDIFFPPPNKLCCAIEYLSLSKHSDRSVAYAACRTVHALVPTGIATTTQRCNVIPRVHIHAVDAPEDSVTARPLLLLD